jgi:hypothetical protein
MGYIHVVDCSSSMKRSEVLIHVAARTNFGNMVSEGSHQTKDHILWIPFI